MKEPDIDPKFLSPYNPQFTEDRIYKLWENSGFFNPDVCIEKGIINEDAEPFTLIMPPTNANGSLHAGHGLVMTIEDLIVRYKRMRGFKICGAGKALRANEGRPCVVFQAP